MARGVSLSQLKTDLRVVLGHSTNVAVDAAFDDSLKNAIRNAQKELYDEFDWPFLRGTKDKTISAGQRYYDFPAGLANPENLSEVKVRWNGRYVPVEYGITLEDYNAHNSDNDERADPVLKWSVKNTGTVQFEVWPLPATSTTMRFRGRYDLAALVENSDTANLDDRLIVYRAAAILAKNEKLAQKFATLEGRRMAVVRSRWGTQPAEEPVVPGSAPRRPTHRGTIIRVSSS